MPRRRRPKAQPRRPPIAKKETKKTSPVFWIGLLSIGAAAYFLTTPEETVSVKSKPKAKATKKVDKDGFLAEDYTAKFPPLNVSIKNAFKPGVVSMRNSGMNSGAPNAVPGGPGGSWIFTGTAEVNGSVSALIENASNGEGQFLKIGDPWLTMTVAGISNSALRLRKEDGDVIVVRLEGSMGTESASSSLAPLTPPVNGGPLRGPIGNVDVRPLNANANPSGPAADSRVSIGGRNAN